MIRKSYPSDVSDAEWGFVAPYLTLMTLDAPQREHDLRVVFDALRWLVRCGAPWRYLPGDFPPWAAVYQQTTRWIRAGSFEAIVHDLRELLRLAEGRNGRHHDCPSPCRQARQGETISLSTCPHRLQLLAACRI